MTDSAYFVKSTPLTVFVRSFQNIVKMCTWEFDAEKYFFLQNGRVFNLAILRQLHLVNDS